MKLRSKKWKCLAHGDKTDWIVSTPHCFHCRYCSGKESLSRELRDFSLSGDWWWLMAGDQRGVDWAVQGQHLKQAWGISSVLEVTSLGMRCLKHREKRQGNLLVWGLRVREVYKRVGIIRGKRCKLIHKDHDSVRFLKHSKLQSGSV